MTGILLRNILGARFDGIPAAVKAQDAIGTSRVMGGTNPLRRLVRVIAALPAPARGRPFISASSRDRTSRNGTAVSATAGFKP